MATLRRPFIGSREIPLRLLRRTSLPCVLWEGRRTKHNAARVSRRSRADMGGGRVSGILGSSGSLHVASPRVCVWVIKESDCHIRRPTRAGCGPGVRPPCPSAGRSALFFSSSVPVGQPCATSLPRHVSLLSLVLRSPKPSHSQILPALAESRNRIRHGIFSARLISTNKSDTADASI